MTDFLEDHTPRPLTGEFAGAETVGLFVGQGSNAFEVVVLRTASRPTKGQLTKWWTDRRGGRAAPVLIVALHPDGASLCAPAGEDPVIAYDLDPSQVERLCEAALDEPDREGARRLVVDQLPALEDSLAGLRNEGLFAMHALRRFAHPDDGVETAAHAEARARAKPIAKRTGERLLEGLGYDVGRADNLSLLLRRGEKQRALAVLLQRGERPETNNDRFNGLSPVSYAVSKGAEKGLKWVILARGRELRLYPTGEEGVGARGSTETYVEINTALLSDAEIGWLWSLFSAEALDENGAVAVLLEKSRRYAVDLAVRLRERIYTETVPKLAAAIVRARRLEKPTAADLELTYRMTLLVLFRLLFIAYAEDGDLLPYRTNEAYRRRSLKEKARDLLRAYQDGTEPGEHDHLWGEVAELFRAVDHGNDMWGVPAYNGGLFSTDAGVNAAGAAIAGLSIPDADFVPALRSLVLSFDDDHYGPVDFRSLGVREFGTIYEGLLESELAVAETDLITKNAARSRPRANPKAEDLVLQPATGAQEPEIRAGEVYLHNRSGARKATGSYYTKPFAVEHLLEKALEPALGEHFARLDAMDELDASRALFDFRVADIAMGSAHFLVAAIDRIERRMAAYLIRRKEEGRPLTRVLAELDDLKTAARRALGPSGATIEIEDTQLLRRLIARRCIYGTDINDMAVMLARLAVWIHTFVPGLPLAVLDHNLSIGNALVGVGTVGEIEDKLEKAKADLFGADVSKWLERAEPALERLRAIADASLKDVEASRKAMGEAKEALADLRQLCDVIVAAPLSDDVEFRPEQWTDTAKNDLDRAATVRAAREALNGLYPFHFPVEFPEIFLRERPGFDVMVGNPPWKEAMSDTLQFWVRHFPGLRGLNKREQTRRMVELPAERPDLQQTFVQEAQIADRFRKTLVTGNYPGMETGHPDVYKAFCWRYWHLTVREGGRFSVVLPRSAWAAKGSTEFRTTAFTEARHVDLTMLLNKSGWVFDEVEHRYTVTLATVERGASNGATVRLVGPFDRPSTYKARTDGAAHEFMGTDALGWNDTATLPLLPNSDSFEVFARMREAPRLDLDVLGEWRVRAEQELNATFDKPLFDMVSEERPDGYWPVVKGETFNIWRPEGGQFYGYADPEPVLKRLFEKRRRGTSRSAHAEFSTSYREDPKTITALRPRILIRDITNRTNQRTVIAALVPPRRFAVNQAPCLLWPRGDERDEAFLLAVLSSLPLDWYARGFIELHLNFHVLNPFPIPRPPRSSPLWQRAVALSGRLAAVDGRYADWAAAVGVEHGPVPAGDKADMIHELDAVVAHLYRLTRPMLTHIFETFHEGWDHAPRMNAVLAHYDDWAERLGHPDYDETIDAPAMEAAQ